MTKEEWDKKQKYYEDEVKKIELPEWPTEAEVKNLSAKIDYLFTRAIFDHGRAKIADDNIDRLIDKVSKLNLLGSNAEERKRRSIEAVIKHKKEDGTEEDLFEIQEETNRRLIDMEGVLKSLDNKLRTLTLSYGTLKMESNLHRN